jgi:hypothetical protein
MTELSSSQFSFGLSSATALRTRLLEALGAEPEWTAGTEDSIDVVWLKTKNRQRPQKLLGTASRSVIGIETATLSSTECVCPP